MYRVWTRYGWHVTNDRPTRTQIMGSNQIEQVGNPNVKPPIAELVIVALGRLILWGATASAAAMAVLLYAQGAAPVWTAFAAGWCVFLFMFSLAEMML